MSKAIKYSPGQLHALQLDENTVALVMPVDYAAAVRDVLRHVAGGRYSSRRKWTGMACDALTGLKDFPLSNESDISADNRMIFFTDNNVVLP